MDRGSIQTAAKLLAKAQSTASDEEAAALVEKSYRLLAGFLNAADQEAEDAGNLRRRERRLRRDRRAGRRTNVSAVPAPAQDPGVAYRRLAHGLRPQATGAFDLTA